jgi:two-component system, sensor histidine kinase YesM
MKWTIRLKIFISFSLLILLSCSVISLIWYEKFTHSTANVIRNHTIQNIREANQNIELILKDMDLISSVISLNQNTIIHALTVDNASRSEYEQLLLDRKVDDLLNSFMSYKYYISNILISGENGKTFVASGGSFASPSLFRSQPWYLEMVAKQGDKLFIGTHDLQNLNAISDIQSRNVISITRAIMNGSDYLGFVNVDVDYMVVDKIFNQSVSADTKLLVVDPNNRIVFHPDYNLLGQQLSHTPFAEMENRVKRPEAELEVEINGHRMFTYYLESPYTHWTTIALIPMANMTAEANKAANQTMLIPVLTLLAALAVATVLAHRITRNLILLRNAMKEVERGNTHVSLHLQATDEVADLSRRFDSMVAEIDRLIEDTRQNERKKNEYELKALQAQINPHFIFNTLNSIKWMAEIQKADNIERLVSSLLQLLHVSMGKGNDFITVREELAYINNYFTIQEYRYLNQFTLQIDVEEGILDCSILKFLLQPLAENALIHGIGQMQMPGVISIKGYREGELIRFIVMDNGMGMKEQPLAKVRSDQQFSGIGLRNVKQRIKLNYGDPYGLTLESVEGLFTKVEICIPYRKGG